MTTSRKLLVTGANGFVAGSVLAQAGPEWEVHALSRGAAPTGCRAATWHSGDYSAPAELRRIFCEVRPDVVIHTAALADIDFCQSHPELAAAVNVELTRNLVELCGAAEARLVFCSTDTVFDGEHAPYEETAEPRPVNYYAETKVAGETFVRKLGRNFAVARLALVVGLPVLGAGNSFLARMLASLQEGRTVTVPTHEIRTPVDAITAGRALLELAANAAEGTFHLAGTERLTRFAMAQQIARHFGLSEALILPQDGAAVPGRAPRPRDVSLANTWTCAQLHTPCRTLAEGLRLIQKLSKDSPP